MPYRIVPQTDAFVVDAPPPRSTRPLLILALTAGAHLAALGAFVLLNKDPARPTTEIVDVLSGAIDMSDGSVALHGFRRARVRVDRGRGSE